jgi:type I restriction enzyme S subunit
MGVKPGYKRTEVGVIPEEWEVKPMGELGQVRTGPFGTLLKADEYAGTDGVPLVSVGEIGEGSFRVTDKTPRVPAKVVRRLPQYVLKTGDIVFGRKGAVDRSALVGPSQHGWFLGSDGISLRLNDACNPSYVAWQFQRPEVRAWLIQNAVGTTMASLNQKMLAGVTVPWAPRTEQQAIATALSDVDALLTQLDRLIAKKRDIKQAAMRQLLTGKTRLPGFDGEWKAKRLGDLGEFLKGSGVTRDQSNSGDLPCIRYGEIYTSHNDVVRAFQSFISHSVAATALRLRKSDILFAGSGETKEEIGKCVAFVDDFEAYAGGDIVVLRPRSADAVFIGYALNAPAVAKQKASRGQGDAVVHISAAALADIEVALPEVAEQTAIATLLSDLDAELTALEARRDKTHALKQGMMQELLTGRTRLA